MTTRTTSSFISVTPTVTASSTYSAGNTVGGLMTFLGAVVPSSNTGILESVTITSKTVQTGEIDLYLFNQNPSASTWTDKSAPAINAADVSKVIGVYKLSSTASGLGTHTIYNLNGIAQSFGILLPNQALYGVLVTPAQPSAQFGTTSDLVVTLGILND